MQWSPPTPLGGVCFDAIRRRATYRRGSGGSGGWSPANWPQNTRSLLARFYIGHVLGTSRRQAKLLTVTIRSFLRFCIRPPRQFHLPPYFYKGSNAQNRIKNVIFSALRCEWSSKNRCSTLFYVIVLTNKLIFT